MTAGQFEATQTNPVERRHPRLRTSIPRSRPAGSPDLSSPMTHDDADWCASSALRSPDHPITGSPDLSPITAITRDHGDPHVPLPVLLQALKEARHRYFLLRRLVYLRRIQERCRLRKLEELARLRRAAQAGAGIHTCQPTTENSRPNH